MFDSYDPEITIEGETIPFTFSLPRKESIQLRRSFLNLVIIPKNAI